MFLPKKTRTLMSQRKGEAKLRDRVKVYLRHIRQPQNQELEAKGYLQFRDKGKLWIFPLLQLHSENTNINQSYEKQNRTK